MLQGTEKLWRGVFMGRFGLPSKNQESAHKLAGSWQVRGAMQAEHSLGQTGSALLAAHVPTWQTTYPKLNSVPWCWRGSTQFAVDSPSHACLRLIVWPCTCIGMCLSS